MVLTNCPPGCTIVPTICLCTGRTRQRQAANGKIIPESPLILQQVRKLLRDDFGRLNQSLQTALDGTGQALVQRLKQSTGMDQLEAAVVRASSLFEIGISHCFCASGAGQLTAQFHDLRQKLLIALDARHSLQMRLLRLRQAREGLAECERTAKSGDRAALCHQARQALLPVLELASGVEESAVEWEGEERIRELVRFMANLQTKCFISSQPCFPNKFPQRWPNWISSTLSSNLRPHWKAFKCCSMASNRSWIHGEKASPTTSGASKYLVVLQMQPSV